MIVTLTEDNFEKEVLKAEGTVLVDFWAEWCGPCRMLSPVVDQIAEEMGDKIKVGKLNVDDQAYIARKYKIMSIPTLIVFKDGEVVNKSVGFINKQQIAAMVQ
ncbi:MAG: thioredoxin [Eubacterium sp.]|nr:thioredoxin [Eubacterium sp.]